jgi:hypothetical protein
METMGNLLRQQRSPGLIMDMIANREISGS